jgi:O-ureido-D-serine cyclo-ligase
MIDLALVSAFAAIELDEDLAPLLAAAERAGLTAAVWCWDDAAVDWSACRLALLRSPWDYTERYPEFLAWLAHVANRSVLLNPPELVRWNTDKRYLAELAAAGVAIVPTLFLAPGEPLPEELPNEFVLKPAVGAGSKGALRLRCNERQRAEAHLAELHAAGQVVLLQPYLDRVDARGEAALIHFDGHYSHSITKGPLLRPQQALVEGLYALEQISVRVPDAAQIEAAQHVLHVVQGLPICAGQAPLYARVDLLEGDQGEALLLELELAEPSLFFAHCPTAADRLIAAVQQRLEVIRPSTSDQPILSSTSP